MKKIILFSILLSFAGSVFFAGSALASALTVGVYVNPNSGKSGDILVVNVNIDNNTGSDINNVNFSVNNSADWKLVPGSVTVDGADASDSALSGYNLGTVSLSTRFVSFNIKLLNTVDTSVTVNVSGAGVGTTSQSAEINKGLQASNPGNQPTSANTPSAGGNCSIDYTNPSGVTSTQLCNPLPQNNLDSFLTSIIKVILAATAGFAVIMIVTAGVRMVVSAGNQEAVAGAKSQITWSLIGLIIAILAYTIISVVINALQGKS